MQGAQIVKMLPTPYGRLQPQNRSKKGGRATPPKTHPRPTPHAMTPDPQHFDPPKAEKPNEINPPLGKCPINRKVSAKCPLEKCVRVRYIAAQPMKCLFLPETLMNQNDTKTHCKHGHLFDEANTYHYRGTRICKACRDRRNRETPSQRVTRRAAERKAKDEARSAALLAREGGAELTRAKLLTAHIADLETQLSDARSALKRLVIRRFCTRGHEIPADRDKCGQCAKRGAIARFYAKKKQATRPTP